jgi:membrane protein
MECPRRRVNTSLYLGTVIEVVRQPFAEVKMIGRAELRAKIIRVLKYVRRAEVPNRAASVSYYAMLASIPLLAVVVTLSAQLLPDMHYAHAVGMGAITTAELNAALERLLPYEANKIIKSEIARLQSQPPVGMLSVGVLLSLWTASNAYMALLTAMNEIYGVVETRPYWKVRLTALVMPIVFAVILLIALIGIIVAPTIISFFELDYFASSLMTLVQWGVIYGIVLITFEMAYRLGPRRQVRKAPLSTGSIVGATIFLVSSLLFQLYVQHYGSYDRVYGSLGGFVVFLVWIWMSSACLLLGCAINKALDEEVLAPLRNIKELVRQLD